MVVSTPCRQTRVEDGITFEWFSQGYMKAWIARNGNGIVVVPPETSLSNCWNVYVPKSGQHNPITGEDAERQAFSVAALFAKQKQ